MNINLVLTLFTIERATTITYVGVTKIHRNKVTKATRRLPIANFSQCNRDGKNISKTLNTLLTHIKSIHTHTHLSFDYLTVSSHSTLCRSVSSTFHMVHEIYHTPHSFWCVLLYKINKHQIVIYIQILFYSFTFYFSQHFKFIVTLMLNVYIEFRYSDTCIEMLERK